MEVPVTNRLRLALRLTALVGTGYFLVATSEPYEPYGTQICNHPDQALVFHVTGTCGPDGDVTITSPANDCTIAVEGGGAVGLPAAGRFSYLDGEVVSLTANLWSLSGYLPEGATTVRADASFFTVERDAQAAVDVGTSRDSGGTGGQTTVASHGSLVERDCSNSTGSPLSLQCYDGSTLGCHVVLLK